MAILHRWTRPIRENSRCCSLQAFLPYNKTIDIAGNSVSKRKKLTFWGADENDDSLVREVIAGHKTVTADTVEDYYRGYGELGDGGYAAGDLIEVYDLRRNLRCVIRATKVMVIRFGNIPEEVWRGETFSSAEEFRRVHIACMPHIVLHDDFELVTLHFELVEVVAAEMV